ncbi:MAG: hypothetical protein OHK0029_36830 [Armatimonadaceae bacterium]
MKIQRLSIPEAWFSGSPMSRRALFGAPQPVLEPVPMWAWKSLFDGKSFDGWVVQDNKDLWAIENGVIHCLGKGGGYLRTAEKYEDYVLALEFNVDKGVNSGVFIRWSNPNDPVNTGIEVQVLDSAGKATPDKHDSGALYDLVAPSSNPMKPAGEWNQMLISCKGPMVSVGLNGIPVASMDVSKYTEAGKSPDGTKNKFKYPMASLPRSGYIGFQNHGGSVWYKNILLLPL